MQLLREGDALYVGHFGPSGMGTSILDVSDPSAPRLVDQLPAPPGTHTHKVQVADGLLLVNEEQFRGGTGHSAGHASSTTSRSIRSRRAVGRLETGGLGVHRIVWTGGRYAHASATPEGFADRIWIVVDLADPTHAARGGALAARRAAAGGQALRRAPRAARRRHRLPRLRRRGPGRARRRRHHAAAASSRGSSWAGGDTHTCLPLPGRSSSSSPTSRSWTATRRAAPRPGRRRRRPGGAARRRRLPAAAAAFDELRFGPHNLHENRAGSYRSERLVFVTYFNAGLRVYDLADPAAPSEVAHWQPEAPRPGRAADERPLRRRGRPRLADRPVSPAGWTCREPEPEFAALLPASRAGPLTAIVILSDQ